MIRAEKASRQLSNIEKWISKTTAKYQRRHVLLAVVKQSQVNSVNRASGKETKRER